LGGVVVLALAGWLVTGAAAQPSGGHASGQIYLYANVGNPIGQLNPPLVKPSTLVEFEDGSWEIVDLRWSSWGANVAHATGVSSSSNCKPNCSGGRRTHYAAQLTLSHPQILLGRRVYGCFQLTIPATPTANQHMCIKRVGSLYIYSSVRKTSPPAATTDARFYTPSRNISCELFDDGSSKADVSCLMRSPQAITHLSATGRATICQHRPQNRCTGNFGEGPPAFHLLPYGSSVKVGRFRCSSAFNGVTCTVIATGQGVFVSKQLVKRVG
jgi:hypothetical protein